MAERAGLGSGVPLPASEPTSQQSQEPRSSAPSLWAPAPPFPKFRRVTPNTSLTSLMPVSLLWHDSSNSTYLVFFSKEPNEQISSLNLNSEAPEDCPSHLEQQPRLCSWPLQPTPSFPLTSSSSRGPVPSSPQSQPSALLFLEHT